MHVCTEAMHMVTFTPEVLKPTLRCPLVYKDVKTILSVHDQCYFKCSRQTSKIRLESDCVLGQIS